MNIIRLFNALSICVNATTIRDVMEGISDDTEQDKTAIALVLFLS